MAISSEFRSLRIAILGVSEKKRAPPPKNGS
jgi:hypothetical protein